LIPAKSLISKFPNLGNKNWPSIRPSLRLPQPERNSPIALPQHENQQDPQLLAEVGEKNRSSSSNSKFKTSLGHFSHWTTIKGDNLTRRLDVSAYKNFEFGIAEAAEASIARGEGVDFDSAMEQILDRSPNLINEQRSSRTALLQISVCKYAEMLK
jgi:hypothetical protein